MKEEELIEWLKEKFDTDDLEEIRDRISGLWELRT